MATITITGLDKIIDAGWTMKIDKQNEWYYVHFESDTSLIGGAGLTLVDAIKSAMRTYDHNNNNRPRRSSAPSEND